MGPKIAKAATGVFNMSMPTAISFDFSIPSEDANGTKYFGLGINESGKSIFTLSESTDASVSSAV